MLEPPEDLWELPLEARSGVTDLNGELYYVLSDGFVSRKGFCEGFYCTGLWCSYSNTVNVHSPAALSSLFLGRLKVACFTFSICDI